MDRVAPRARGPSAATPRSPLIFWPWVSRRKRVQYVWPSWSLLFSPVTRFAA